MRETLSRLPEPPAHPRLGRHDWLAALGVFLVVFLSTFPVVTPFLFIHEARLALRVSNGIAIAMLFMSGYAFGRYSGFRPGKSWFWPWWSLAWRWSRRRWRSGMRATQQLAVLSVVVLMGGHPVGQEPPAAAPAVAKDPWAYNLTVDGYIVPNDESYVDPVFTADRNWLHLEARYNYENLRTGSLWAGYNFSAGKKLVLDVTPMIGGVFGRTTGIAPGCEASLTYKKVQLSISNEYVFDTTHKSGNFYYSWPAADLLASGLVSCRPGRGAYEGFPDQPRRAARILGRGVP